MTETLAQHRGKAPPSGLEGPSGTLPHPYTAGMAAVEREFADDARVVLAKRTWGASLALLLVGCLAIDTGMAVRSKGARRALAVAAAAVALALAVTSFLTPLDAWVFHLSKPALRLHAQHPIATTFVVLVECLGLVLLAKRSADRLVTDSAAEVA